MGVRVLLSLLTLSAQAAYPALSVPVESDRLRLIIVGDTGAMPVTEEEGAAWEGSHYNTVAIRDQLRRSMKAEGADGIVAMGDLIYGPTFAQLSPKCRDTDAVAEQWLDPLLGDYFEGLPTTWLALGNHDVGHYLYSRKRARCLRYYAATTENIRLPETAYSVDLGLAQLLVVDTNRPPKRWPSAEMQRRIEAGSGWVIMGGHHVLKTTFDKEDEVEIRQWLSESGTKPDLWINGHAHFLQFGVYDGIPALTSGSGSKVRVRPDCPGPECTGEEPPLFSRSTFGYAVVDLTEETMTVRFKDAEGSPLYCWEKTRGGEGGPCALEEPAAAEVVPEAAELGSFPMCEASAALTLPDGSVLVADNEVKDALFSFAYDGALRGQERQEFAASKKARIEDIEALAGIDGSGVLMVGSHSRSKKCKLQPERRRLGLGSERVKTSDEEWAAMTASEDACRSELFGGAAGEGVGLLCAAIVAAESAAVEGEEGTCGETLNIEGAMTDAEGRTWLGLRAPVVAERGAAMVRLSADFLDQGALSLDAVAWVTLPPQQAIRELHADGDVFLGIAGTVVDSGGDMTLWRAPMSRLEPGARLSVERLSPLPPSSEGLTRVGEALVVVVDGDTPKDDSATACVAPSGQLSLRLAP